MTLEEVKNYLKVDFSDDDNLIRMMIEVAREYIEAAAGKYDDGSYRMRLMLLALVAELYENRTFITDKRDERTARLLRNMLLQISLEEGEE